MNLPAVDVYGATGHTGKFVLRELERRGFATVPIGRNHQLVASDGRPSYRGPWRQAACDDPDALDAALDGVAAVINCAGPFLDTAPAVVEAALHRRIHYFDITAEQRSARQSLATYQEEARQCGTVVVPAFAFFGGLADLLAAEVTRDVRSLVRIEVGVALDSWHPTAGTRKTGERNAARRLIIEGGALSPLPHPGPMREWLFPEPFGLQPVRAVPLSEIITISRHIAAPNICSYMNMAPLRDLNDGQVSAPHASDPSGRSSQRFIMHVCALSTDDRSEIAAAGRDIYAVTAPLVVEACVRVLRTPPAAGGTFAPAELFDTTDFLAALSADLRITRARGALRPTEQ